MLVSIIVPTFNRVRYLPDLWRSTIDQSYRPLQFVLVDDGSTDTTAERYAEWIAQVGCNDISWHIIRGRNRGAPAARNAGFHASQGDAIMFVDSDDVIAPRGVELLTQALNDNPYSQYAYGLVQRTDSDLHPLLEKPIGSLFHGSSSEFAGYHWHTMGALYRRTCVKAVGEWNDQLTGSQDWEYQARVKAYGGQSCLVDSVVGYWRQHHALKVGASSFRPDYVKSVLLACQLIMVHARRSGNCDDALKILLARRVMVHAIEYGAHGLTYDKFKCSLLALQFYHKSDCLGYALRLLSFTPPICDKAIHAFLRWRRT
jgi:glycosyltransferase involved in cell wall biosynthesis